MNRILPILMTLSLMTVMNRPALAQQGEGETEVKKPGLQLAFSMSMMNSYARGNLDDFFHSISGDATRDVTAGSAAYFGMSGVFATYGITIGF